MSWSSVTRVSKFLGCVIAAAITHGCAVDAPPVDDPDEGMIDSDATACGAITSTWWNTTIPEQTGAFTIEFSATPSHGAIDAVIGLGDRTARTWTDLAAIVRFNPQGFIDVRDGGAYAASTYRYQAGVRYRIRMEVRVGGSFRNYTVAVAKPGTYGFETIAMYMAFRTEQSAIARVTNVASFVQGAGSLDLCVGTPFPVEPTCPPAVTKDQFVNTSIASTGPMMVVDVGAKASASNMDGVFGLTLGPADAYNDYAASVRFATSGVLEARSGDVYRADTAVPYAAGDSFKLTFVVNVAAKTYSVVAVRTPVFGGSGDDPPVLLARDYAFRSQQATVTALDNFARVMSSTFGQLDSCAINRAPSNLALARHGTYEVLPLTGDAVLLADQTRTQRLDASGRVTATATRTGMPTVDSAGNIYLARIAGSTLTVDALTPTLALRWTRSFTVGGNRLAAVGTNTARDVTIAIANDIAAVAVERLATDGTRRPTVALPASVRAIGFDSSGYALVRRLADAHAVEQYTTTGALVWRRTIAGDFTASMARGSDRSVVLAGRVHQTTDFGDGPITPYWNPESDQSTYIALFDSTGATVFSQALHTAEIGGVATNGTTIAVSTWDQTQFYWMELQLFDRTGAQRAWGDGSFDEFGFGLQGTTGSVAISSSGRVYQNIFTGNLNRHVRWPVLIAISP